MGIWFTGFNKLKWISGIEHKLAIMPRPSGVEELSQWREEGVDVVVSLLTFSEEVLLGLDEEVDMCRELNIEFLSLPIPDRGVSESMQGVSRLVELLCRQLGAGKAVVIHCRMGIGRSGMIAACVLVRLGLSTSEAFTLISAARGVQVPDIDDQRVWVEQFAASQ